MIDVSFIIPVYNSEKTIVRCLKSISKIDKNEIEIIIVDDGSTDETPNICKEFCNDKRVKYYRKDNNGVAAARNYGIKKAQGKYIFFVDSDDEIDYNAVQKMILQTIQVNADWATFGYIIVKKHRKIRCPQDNKNNGFFNGIENIKQGYVWGNLYKTKIIIDNSLIFDTTMDFAEDMLFNLNFSMLINKCISIDECGYYYYLNNNSLSRKYCNNYIESMNKIREAFRKLFKTYPNYEEYYEKKFGSIELSIANGYIRNELRNKQNNKLTKKIKVIKESQYLTGINDIKKDTIKGIYNKLAFIILKTNNPTLIVLFYSLVNFLRG